MTILFSDIRNFTTLSEAILQCRASCRRPAADRHRHRRHTGTLMMGTIGEKHRMDGTVISDAVNLASRVEGLTKTYGVRLLVSQYTVENLADPKAYDIRPIDVVVVKGKTHPVTICEVFQRDPAEQRAAEAGTRELLQSGVEALARRDLACARRFFEESLRKLPGDMAASNLLQKCG